MVISPVATKKTDAVADEQPVLPAIAPTPSLENDHQVVISPVATEKTDAVADEQPVLPAIAPNPSLENDHEVTRGCCGDYRFIVKHRSAR